MAAEEKKSGLFSDFLGDLKDLAKVGVEGYLAVQTAKATASAAKAAPVQAPEKPRSEAAQETAQNQTMKYVLIGGGVLAVVGLFAFIATRKGGE